jgi:hypothetical protein
MFNTFSQFKISKIIAFKGYEVENGTWLVGYLFIL